MNEEYADKLYDSLHGEGWVTVSKDEFKSSLNDDSYKQKLYDSLSSEGLVTVGYDEFSTSVGGDSKGKSEAEPMESTSGSEVTELASEETTTDGGLESSEIKEGFKYTPEDEGVDRYTQKGKETLPQEVESLKERKKYLEDGIADFSSKETRTSTPYGGVSTNPYQSQINKYKAELEQVDNLLKTKNQEKAFIDTDYTSQMIDGDSGELSEMVKKEQSLEGTAGDFIERTAAKIFRPMFPFPDIKTEAEQKQIEKSKLEGEISEEIDRSKQSLQTRIDQYGEAVDRFNEFDLETELEGIPITSEEQFNEEANKIVDTYNKELATLKKEQKTLQNYSDDYVGALDDIALINEYDDLSSLESFSKSAANELIKTPRQAAGLVKAASSLIKIGAIPNYGVTQEGYLDAVSPVTDWLTEQSDKNLFRLDSDDEAANMIGSTVTQLAKIIPASIAAPAAGLTVTAGMSFDEMYDTARNTEGITEAEAVNLGSAYAPIGMALEYVGAKTGVDIAARKILTKKIINMAKNKGILGIQKKALSSEINQFASKEFGSNILKEFVEEGVTEMAQTAAMEGVKLAKNTIEGKEVFEVGGEAFIKDLWKSGLYGGLAGGGVATVTGAVSNSGRTAYGDYRKTLLNTGALNKVIDKTVNSKSLTQEEKTRIVETLKSDQETLYEVRKITTDPVKERTLVELMSEKKALESQKPTDKVLAEGVQEKIDVVNDRIRKVIGTDKEANEGNKTEGKPEQKQGGATKTKEVEATVKSNIEPVNTQEPTNKVLGEVDNSEYGEFVNTGKVSNERINSIAEKVKNNEPLSKREEAIFTDKTTEVNEAIIEPKPATKPKPTKQEVKPKVKPVNIDEQMNEGAIKEDKNPPTPPPTTTIAKEADNNLVSIMKKSVPQETQDNLKGEMAALTMKDKDIFDQGREAVDSGEIDPILVAKEVRDSPRALTAKETAAAIYYKARKMQEISILEKKQESLDPKSGDANAINSDLRIAQSEMDELNAATMLSGKVQGQAFRLRQLLIEKNQMTIEYQKREYAIKNNGKAPSTEQVAEMESEIKRYKEKLKERDKLVAEQAKEINTLKPLAAKGIKRVDRDAVIKKLRSAKIVKSMKDLSKLQSNPVQALIQVAWDGSIEMAIKAIKAEQGVNNAVRAGVDSLKKSEWYKSLSAAAKKKAEKIFGKDLFDAISKKSKITPPHRNDDGELVIPSKFISELVKDGFNKVETANAELLRIANELDLNATPAEIEVAVSNYGKTSSLKQDDISKAVREIKRLDGLFARLRDVKKKKRPLKTGAKRDKLTLREKNLMKEINELLKDIPMDKVESEALYKSALEKLHARLDGIIEDLENQIKTGERPQSKKKMKLDDSALEKKERIRQLKEIRDEKLGKKGLTYEQRVANAEAALERTIQTKKDNLKNGVFTLNRPEQVQSAKLTKLRGEKSALDAVYKILQAKDPEVRRQKLEAEKKSLEGKIADVERKIKEKDFSGAKKKTKTDHAEVKALKEDLANKRKAYQELKKINDKNSGKGIYSKEQKVARAEAAIEKAIKDRKEKLKNGEFFSEKSEKVHSTKLDKLRAEKKELDKEYKEAKEKSAEGIAKAEEKEIVRLDEKRYDLQQKINKEIGLEVKRQSKKYKSPTVVAKEAEIAALQEVLKDTDHYKEFAEKKKIANAEKAKERRIEEYERRLREGDFAPRKKKEPVTSDKIVDLDVELHRLKAQMEINQEKYRLHNRNWKERAADHLFQIFSLPRTLMASMDLSAVFRQGFITSARHPVIASKAFVEMFKQMWSKKRYDAWEAALDSSPNYHFANSMGLSVTKSNAKITAREEMFVNRLAGRIGNFKIKGKTYGWGAGIEATNRAYASYLNVLRMGVFNDFVDKQIANGVDPHLESNKKIFKGMATFINNCTGRGELPLDLEQVKTITTGLNSLFFAPKYVISRFNVLFTPISMITAAPAVRMEMLTTLMSFGATASTVLGLALMAGAEVEDDPASSDWGKIRFGNLRYDIFAGLQQPARLLYAMVNGEIKSTRTDKVTKVDSGKYNSTKRIDLIGKFLRGKLSPSTAAITDAMYGIQHWDKTKAASMFGYEYPYEVAIRFENTIGEEMTMGDKAASMMIPLFLQDMYSIYEDEGAGMAVGAVIPALFGMGASYYTPDVRDYTTKDFDGVETIYDDVDVTLEDYDNLYEDIEVGADDIDIE